MLKEEVILHIPHSSTIIPSYDDYIVDINVINKELIKLTDWYTDIIFNIKDVEQLIFPYSRIFCDVERFDDENEVMFKFGRGFYYTKCDNGEELRNENSKIKVWDDYYLKHHKLLEEKSDEIIEKYGRCIIIDCHSFSEIPFETDLIKDNNRFDICIGTDEYHTPQWLLDKIKNNFIDNGYTVSVNNPYSGTMIPLKHYNKDKNLLSIMIEVNRRIYLNEDLSIKTIEVDKLNKIITNLF